MKIDRELLVAMLEKVKPALASRDLIPELQCFCFSTRGVVNASSDPVLMRMPMPKGWGVVGSVKGKLLLDLLASSKAKEVELIQTGSDLIVKAGRSKLAFSVGPESGFMFDEPDLAGSKPLPSTEDFIGGMRQASIAMGEDPAEEWRYGITIVIQSGGFSFYAADGRTGVRVVIGTGGKATNTLILNPKFVKILLDSAKTDPVRSLSASPNFVSAKFGSGLELFCSSVRGIDMSKYNDAFGGEDNLSGPDRPIPEGLDECLARAAVLAPTLSDPHTTFRASKGKLLLETGGPGSRVDDSLDYESPDSSTARCEASLVARGLEHADDMEVMPDLIRLSGAGFTYLISSAVGAEQPPVQEKPTARKRLILPE